MSQPAGDKPSLKGAWSRQSNQFSNFTPNEISSEWLKLQTWNFVHWLATRSTNLQMTNCPRSGRGQGQMANFRISHPLKYLRVRRLYQFLAFGRPTIPLKGVARVTWSISKFYTPLNFSGMAEDRIVKFYARLDARTVSLVMMISCPPGGPS